MAILSITLFSNTVNATSITDTKERIKEIKIVEEVNIERLIRNKKVSIVINYARSTTKVSSRSDIARKEDTQAKVNKINKEQKESKKVENKENKNRAKGSNK